MALGMALASRIQGSSSRSLALLSDGECNEGSIWEAALLAGSQKINTLQSLITTNGRRLVVVRKWRSIH